ncbi:hypothetical protein ASA_1819 [Aeromonas salmonicida subsp. salmonicida A449]|uniref:Uncharacterized protein n=1 Tax=Aeromonas salmonicida (strain A449) TaxID=382245 RepID=A4SLX3_AERS4|nr:hypothetical protein ASA_1819 [Aeromonas salmonicida subsp. salmonicida A449]
MAKNLPKINKLVIDWRSFVCLNGKGRVIRLCQPVSSSSLLSCRSLLRPAVVIVTSLKTFVYDSDYPFIFSCLPISFRSFSFLV